MCHSAVYQSVASSNHSKAQKEKKKKSFQSSSESAMIEFKECPEFPIWFAQTKFSLCGCTKKEIRVSKDSSKTESHNQ